MTEYALFMNMVNLLSVKVVFLVMIKVTPA